jgi:hypothetical protein
MDFLYYVLIFIAVVLVSFGGVKLKNYYNLKESDIQFMGLVLKVVDYISSKFEYKFKDGISKVVEYSIIALVIVDETEKIDDLKQKLYIVKDKAIKLCVENGIEVDSGIVEIIDEIVEYIV